MKHFYTLILTLAILNAFAQDPDFALDYIQNKALLNPAYSGKNNFVTFNVTSNYLWLYPNAPQRNTFWFGMHFKHAGLGLITGYKTLGQFYNLSMGGTYYYDIELSRASDLHLSMGLNATFNQDFLNLAEIHTLETDPLLQDQRAYSRFYPQVATGIMLYNEYFEFGMAGFRLLPYSGYFFLNRIDPLPPVFVIHGAYFYTHPLRIYSLATDGVVFASKDQITARVNSQFYPENNIKIGGGISGDYIMAQNITRINLHFITGLRLAKRFYITYELTLNSLNLPIPAITKLGNSLSLRMDFYHYSVDMPEHF